MLLPFGGKVPRDEGAVFVAPNATVLGIIYQQLHIAKHRMHAR